jgi:hypothetical protein
VKIFIILEIVVFEMVPVQVYDRNPLLDTGSNSKNRSGERILVKQLWPVNASVQIR